MENSNSPGLSAPNPLPDNVPVKGQISAIGAIGPALRHMSKVFFQPFKPVKWLKFGLVAFLVALGSGGGGSGFRGNFSSGSKDFSVHKVQPVIDWATAHMTLLIILIVAAVLVISIIWMVVIYFSSRFTFVYLDGVVKNDMQIKRAYKENRLTGWSYFLWRMVFGPTVLLVIVLLLGLVGLGIFLLAKAQGFTALVIILIIFTVLVSVALVIGAAVITLLTYDFVVPIMYLKKLRVVKAWKLLLGLLKFNKARFSLYVIFKILLVLAAGVIILFPCCCLGMIFAPFYLLMAGLVLLALKFPLVWVGVVTIGLAAWVIITVLWHTVISPITVFFRSYSLVFLEGFGKEFYSITQLTQVPARGEYVS